MKGLNDDISHRAKPAPNEDVCKTGFWWCVRCHQITEVVRPGEYNQGCGKCGRLNCVVWKQPLVSRENRMSGNRATVWVGEDRRPNLAVLTMTGYYFCNGCGRITWAKKQDGQELCGKCNSTRVEWVKGLEEKILQ